MIRGSELPSPKELRVSNGRQFILEFNAGLGTKVTRVIPVETAGVVNVQTGWYSARPPRVRINIRIRPELVTGITAIEGGYKVTLGEGSFVKSSDPVDTLPKVTETKTSEPKTTPSEDFLKAAGVVDPNKKPLTDKKTPEKYDPATDPLLKPQTQPPIAENRPAPSAKSAGSKPTTPATKPRKVITVDFVSTDIVVILKAIALQADVNIVTAPDIKGQLTVTLTKVSVEEALDLITSLTDLRYALVNRTFVVAGKDKFNDVMRAVTKTGDRQSETRLVPVYSGEVDQIKNAVTKALPSDSANGAFDIILPGEGVSAKGSKPEAKDGEKPAEKAAGGGNAKRGLDQLYVLLVGSPDVLDLAERVVKNVDQKICEAYGIRIPTSTNLIRDTYVLSNDSLSAKALIDIVREIGGPAFRNVEMYPTPASSDRQSVIMVGRSTDVEEARKLLSEFDGAGDTDFLYEVRYSDPRALRDQLAQAVPGLRVAIPPGSALTPRVYTPPSKKGSGGGNSGGGDEASGGGASGGGGGGTAADAAVKQDKGSVEGLAQPFSDVERIAVPMRLILRGSAQQIERAKSFLEKVDTEPKQIALDLRVMELSKEDAFRAGIDWSIAATGGFVRAFRLNNALDSTATAGSFSGSAQQGGTTGNIAATLDSINGGRNLIARPNFLAVDGRESELFVGDVIRYIESIQSSQNGVTVTTNSVRVGVRCAVLARVGADNRIMMDLRPVVSYLRGFTPVPGGGQLPQTSERVAQSSVTIDSGETIAIGGLIRDEDRKSVSGIPILKDLPIIGRLFSRTDNSRQRSEIVFFLTARVVTKNDRMDAASPRASVRKNATSPQDAYPDPFAKEKKKP